MSWWGVTGDDMALLKVRNAALGTLLIASLVGCATAPDPALMTALVQAVNSNTAATKALTESFARQSDLELRAIREVNAGVSALQAEQTEHFAATKFAPPVPRTGVTVKPVTPCPDTKKGCQARK